MRSIIESIVFFFASLVTFFLIYFRFSVTNLQQITLFLLIVLILYSRFIFATLNHFLSSLSRLSLIFFGAMLVQILVISSGGLYSPFLILLHLFTLGASFLLNTKAAISFLIFSLILLLSSMILDQKMLILFREDPGSAVLYAFSFIVIIPLAQFLMHTYHIKDTLSKVLAEYSKLGRMREEAILQSLKELVFVTDSDLKILSVNGAVEKILHLSDSSLLKHFLIDVLPLKDKDGNSISFNSLSIEDVLDDKVTRIIEGFYFYMPDNRSFAVTIQVRPIIDSKGSVNQIVFVITSTHSIIDYSGEHSDLEQAIVQYQATIRNLKKTLMAANLPKLQTQVEIVGHIEEDLLTALELEDHAIQENIGFEDVAYLCKQIVDGKQQFAQSLGISLQFILSEEEVEEGALIRLRKADIPEETLDDSAFGVPVNARWFQLIVQKLLDVAILLTSGGPSAKVELSVNFDHDSNSVNILITAFCAINESSKDDLFVQYYGDLAAKTNLHFGSGLEGFIANIVAKQIKIPLKVNFGKNPDRVILSLKLTKKLPV